ncbi:lysophospholipid acyltransferase family protein [Aliidiomarina sanyensis]|uniref:Acyltransferase n=1 Tax=Aliidiomarina sanyensis TaxID=1249555 RepID=A0A432WBU3_9GAMM|nr:lysophospholipid acyltransferase family protein [Aliidiomarina sanyensis]RUO29139.1 acyltransferase [Aliidiomarina sanyensis]
MKLLGGWTIHGELPDIPKAIIPVAPHTSNWDFFVGLCVKLALGLRVSFLGKHSIFVFPIRGLLTWLGGIPVKRDSAHGVVGQMVDEFAQREQLVLVIAPEGTRSKVKEWKKGFLHIALGANVPLVPVSFCFKTRRINIADPIWPKEDVEQTLSEIKAFTDQAVGKRPELQ